MGNVSSGDNDSDDFFESDEGVDDIVAAFEQGEQHFTGLPFGATLVTAPRTGSAAPAVALGVPSVVPSSVLVTS